MRSALQRGSAAAAVLTLAAFSLAGRAATAAEHDLPPAPPVWVPVTDSSPAPAPRGFWGLTVGAGAANVRVEVPEEFARTPESELAFARWGAFLGTLLHGDELATVRLVFVRADQMRRTCFPGAIACYLQRERTVVVPTAAPDGWALEHVVAHEYAHHIAASRDNPPWSAFDWGTKRWATAADVCSKVDESTADPLGLNWDATPGEAFAETYRLLNARRSGAWGHAPGWTFGDLFPFNAATLRALELDVRKPWRAAVTEELSGRLTAGATTRVRVRALLDGTVRLRLRSAPDGTLLRASGSDPAAPGGRQIETTACGERTIGVALHARQSGRFVLEVVS